MIKSVLFLFFAVIFANHIFIVSTSDCSMQKSSNRSNECIFECIKILFDEKSCPGTGNGAREPILKRNDSDIFGSLLQHNVISYNASSDSFSTRPANNCDGGDFLRYIRPSILVEFLNCTKGLTVDSDDPISKCTTDNMDLLYGNIIEKLDSEKWCTEALGLSAECMKFRGDSNRVDQEITIDSTSTVATTVTTGGETVDTSSETTSIRTIVTEPTTTEKQATTIETSVSSTSSTTESSVSTTKPPKKKPSRAPPRPVHHYNNSVTIIIAIVGVLLAILVVSAVILSVFVNRRKRMQIRTESRTYVFERD